MRDNGRFAGLRKDFTPREPPKAAEGSDSPSSAGSIALPETVDAFIGYAVTVRTKNQHEWMEGFAEQINLLLSAIGDADRVGFDGRDKIIVLPPSN